jgi:predicted ATP-grasp superfamily ATP-dependent carboligase
VSAPIVPALALAGLSARMMTEAAVRDGYTALALDLFGDVDTRRVAAHWQPIGVAGELRIDAKRLRAALQLLADHDDLIGWVAGSGFEAQPDLLDDGAKLLRLIGMPAAAVRRLRDPRVFIDRLDALGIAHPEVRFERPDDPTGWLSKSADSCGGWHIRWSADSDSDAGASRSRYHQRFRDGAPMSALFVANRNHGVVLGLNELIMQRFGRHPFVYRGAIGPVALAAPAAEAVDAAVQALVAAFEIEGLCSLDFLLDGDEPCVLEINPRPSGSMALYGDAAPPGVMRSHVDACLEGRLPPKPARAVVVTGTEVVFARTEVRVDSTAAAALASRADTHDLPAPGSVFFPGQPVCSLSAWGSDAAQVRTELARRRDALLAFLETHHEHGCTLPIATH